MAVYSVASGACAWTVGLVATWASWGLKGVISAVVLAGLGPIPFGYTAAMLAGQWQSARSIGLGTLFAIVGFVIAGRLLTWPTVSTPAGRNSEEPA